MSDARFTHLENRGVLAVGGDDARSFLQGLISNDVNQSAPDRVLYAAFLTPQGKYLFDFFLAEHDGQFLLDCEAARLDEFRKRLSLYRLRSKVEIADRSGDFAVAAAFGGGGLSLLGLPQEEGAAAAFGGGIAFVDPRLATAGARLVLPTAAAASAIEAAGFARTGFTVYDNHRIGLGLPDGSRDLIVEKTTLLEAGFEELHGVDFDKGCYMGQELTARTKYRGLVKRRLVPVRIEGLMPAAGTPILRDGKQAGEMRSTGDGVGIALLRLEHLADKAGDGFTAGEARILPERPSWANF